MYTANHNKQVGENSSRELSNAIGKNKSLLGLLEKDAKQSLFKDGRIADQQSALKCIERAFRYYPDLLTYEKSGSRLRALIAPHALQQYVRGNPV